MELGLEIWVTFGIMDMGKDCIPKKMNNNNKSKNVGDNCDDVVIIF